MAKNRRFLIGGVIILAALSYVIYGGAAALVYFVTPSELKAKETSSADKFLRMAVWSLKVHCRKT